jgi:outer membrane protein OmpA-like peptidoglycan-associated protein
MHWTRYLNRLRDTPGLVVTQAEKQHGIFQVSGLRDPLADNPSDLIPDGLDPDQIAGHWEPFYAMQPQFVLMRARQLSHPPASTTLTLADNILTASGSAPMAWITRNRPVLSTLPGISRYDDSHLAISDLDARLLEKARLRLRPPKTVTLNVKNGHMIVTGRAPHQWAVSLENNSVAIDGIGSVDKRQLIDNDAMELKKIRQELGQTAIRFSRGTQLAGPGATAALDRTARLIRKLEEVSGHLKTGAVVKILGHTDVAGIKEKNRQLRLARANIIRNQLIIRGIAPAMLRIPEKQNQEATYMKKVTSILMTGRRVTFQVILLKQHQAG